MEANIFNRTGLYRSIHILSLLLQCTYIADGKGVKQMYCFLVNQRAGNGRGRNVWNRVETRLKEKNIPYQAAFSLGKQHAIETAYKWRQDFPDLTLVVIGGDGTLQSVVDFLVDTQVQLGVIPAGSGNDLARALGIPLDAMSALEILLRGQVRGMDVLVAGGTKSLTIIGAGLDAQVAYSTNRSRVKKWFNKLGLGNLSYVVILLKTLFLYHPVNILLRIDGASYELRDVWLIAAANVPSYGGGMKICPGARYDDGLMQVCVVHSISRWAFIRTFPLVYRGNHLKHPGITVYNAKDIEIQSDSPVHVHGDGEIIGTVPLRISLLSNSIRAIGVK
jgi:diacylglycerol kinase (ATP)